MRVLFVSRKKPTDIGGLSRFTNELFSRFPSPKYLLTVTSPLKYFKVPYRNVDLIHLCDATLFPIGVLIKSIIHKPLTVSVHGLDIAFPNPIYQSMLKFTSPKAHAVIVDSEPVKKLLKNFPIKIKRTVVINPGISIEHLTLKNKIQTIEDRTLRIDIERRRWKIENLPSTFQPQNPSSMLHHPSSKIILLTVGNLVKRKGHAWFIKNVFTKLSNRFIYYIVGKGPEKKNIQLTINNLQLSNRIFLLGQISNKQLTIIYQQSDIYICPNQKNSHDFEGFGIAVGEAASMGLAVVASRVDGIPEVIHHKKNGLLVKPTPEGFIKCIDTLIHSRARVSLSQRAKKYTREHFDWKKTIDQYVKVFAEVIKSKK